MYVIYITQQFHNLNKLMMWIFPDQLCFCVGLLYVAVTFVRFVLRFVKRPYNLYQRYGGGWAVVTGGSDGIGLGFCQQLAKLGFNVCVISRNKEKIDKVCEDIKKLNSKIQTKTVVADFSKSLQQGFFQTIVKQIQGLDISLLVNNVGVLTDIGIFMNNKPEDIHKLCTVNLMPATMLSRLLLPKMLARGKRCGMIFLSSSSTMFRLKNSANYCASKLFNQFIANSLQYEYQSKIDFLSVNPALVTTQMARNTTSPLHVNKNQCASGALKSLGKYSQYAGSWWHEIQIFLTMLLSETTRDFIMGDTWGKVGQLYNSIDSKKAVQKANEKNLTH